MRLLAKCLLICSGMTGVYGILPVINSGWMLFALTYTHVFCQFSDDRQISNSHRQYFSNEHN